MANPLDALLAALSGGGFGPPPNDDTPRPHNDAYKFGVAGRSADMKVLASPDLSGATFYAKRGKKVLEIRVPEPDGMYARVVRLHEQLHARYTPGFYKVKDIPPLAAEFGEEVYNFAEDARIQGRHRLDVGGEYPPEMERALAATALTDLRQVMRVFRGGKAPPPRDYNRTVMMAARALSLLDPNSDAWDKVVRHLRKTLSRRTTDRIVNLVAALPDVPTPAAFAEHLREFKSLALLPEPEPPPKKGPISPKGKPTGAVDQDGFDRDGWSVRPDPDKLDSFPWDWLKPPLVANRDSDEPESRPAASGRLDVRAVVRARVRGSVDARLFRRERRIESQGTVLLDCSGSMAPNDRILQELVDRLPGAVICGYSSGRMVLLADHGRRVEKVKYDAWFSGQNDTDYWALKWLLQQPGPRVYVGDGGFGGSPDLDGYGSGQANAASVLARQARASGQMVWFTGYKQALASLKKPR